MRTPLLSVDSELVIATKEAVMSRQDKTARPAGPQIREKLLAEIPLSERRRELAGVTRKQP